MAMENEPVSKLARKQTLPFVKQSCNVICKYRLKNAWIEARCLLQDMKDPKHRRCIDFQVPRNTPVAALFSLLHLQIRPRELPML